MTVQVTHLDSGYCVCAVTEPVSPCSADTNMETIQELLHRQPFEPFEIRLSKGEVYQVRRPEDIAVAKTRLAIAYPEADRIVLCSLVHINSIEAVRAA